MMVDFATAVVILQRQLSGAVVGNTQEFGVGGGFGPF
jgi:hypothetical protein